MQDGTAAVRVGGQTNDSVRYQFDIVNTARECHVQGNQFSVKVGVAGHLLIGPAGTPGAYSAQLRIVVRRDSDQKPEISKVYKIDANTAGGSSGAVPVRFRTVHAALHRSSRRIRTIRSSSASTPGTRDEAPKPHHKKHRELTKARASGLLAARQVKTPSGRDRRSAFAPPAPKAQPPRKRSGQWTAEGMTLWKAAGASIALAHRRG